MKTVVMGQGYVGLPLALAAAKAGHTVIGYEPNPERFEMLSSGVSYIEDVTSDDLKRAYVDTLYEPARDSAQLADFDVAVITVPTPLKNRMPDLSYVKQAAGTVGMYLKRGATVILESTTHPGTTRDVVIPHLQDVSGLKAGDDFHVGFSPERIDPGNPKWTFTNTPKIVSGLTPRCKDIVATFYSTITENVVVAQSLEEAELAKVFENTYRQVNIALVNELARMAHLLGADVFNVLDLCVTKPFGFTKFTPGPGVGGHCIPCDPVYLTHHLRTELGTSFRLVELAQEINDSQPGYIARRIQEALNRRAGRALKKSRILALGASYKPDTADRRESPAVEIVELLRQQGAIVDVVDPFFDPKALGPYEYTEVSDGMDLFIYDAVVVLTNHSAFDLTKIAKNAVFVLDTRGVLPAGDSIERL